MRAFAIAVACAAMLATGAVASAEQFSQGDLKVDLPSGWRLRPQQTNGATALLAFTPSSDCFFYGVPDPNSATLTPSQVVRATASPLAPEVWNAAASNVQDFFDAGSTPQIISSNVDTSGVWPVHRAQLQGSNGVVHGVISSRPGVQLWGFCSGSQANYDAVLNTLGHPNDATWEAQIAAEPPPAQ